MAVRSLLVASLLSSVGLTAARQQRVRRGGDYDIYLNTSRVPSHTAQPSSTYYPEFSFAPETTTTTPSPAATFSSPLAASTLASSTYRHGPLPVGPGSRPFPSSPTGTAASGIYPHSGFSFRPTTTSVDDDCGGATLNVPNATLDWWWTSTAYDAVSQLSFQHNTEGRVTGWTITHVGTGLDASTAISADACDPTPWSYTYLDSDTNQTETFSAYECSQVPVSVAPATSAVTIRAWVPVSKTSGTSFNDVPVRQTAPPPPKATVAGVNATFGADSPFVYFSAYQIVSGNRTTKANGDEICNYVTKTYNMSKPYAFSYADQDPASSTIYPTILSGDLDPWLPTAIGRPQVVLGSFTAIPTVVVVVDEIYEIGFEAALAGTMVTASQLEVPTAKLPAGVSASTSEDIGALYTSLTATAHIEVTNKFLLVPDVTSTVPIPVVQSLQQATSSPTPSPSASPAGVATVESNNGITKPADALDVLTQALGPFIVQGLGANPTPAQTMDIAGATATVSTVSGFVVDGQTAVVGGPAITADGKVISVPAVGDSIVVGGSTVVRPAAGETISANGVQITEAPATVFAVAGQTLLPGGSAITISQTPVALAPGGGAVIIGSSTSILQTRVITVGTQTVTANAATQFVFGPGQTLTPGGTLIVGGTTVSLANGASVVVVNGQTSTITVQAKTTAGALLTIDGQTITPTAGVYVIYGQTLSSGGAITFTGSSGRETVSLDKSGTVMVDIVSGKSTTTTLQGASPVLTIGGQSFTAQAGSTYIINGQTLTPGGVQTVVVGSTTYVLSLSATPTIVEIDQINASGRTTATSYETLITASATPGSGTKDSSPTTTALVGKAASTGFQLISIVVASSALVFAIWL
ncbi:hypothetical protein AMS68_005531 [Peltaster fructicola]|uniref:Uncharacterized protein n=1 Tax=Peltaster fructicola TaxID=286661 RepID=A0A6H0XZ38_9PEZI|nr:hypothetical protein AMS68_005531 [Peltaster fructicola]